MHQYTFAVSGMSCNHCKERVEKACSSLADVQEAVVNLEESCVKITSSNPLDASVVIAAIDDAGFDAKLA
jgi:copper chaperone